MSKTNTKQDIRARQLQETIDRMMRKDNGKVPAKRSLLTPERPVKTHAAIIFQETRL